MNSILTIDKLILKYYLESDERLDISYLAKNHHKSNNYFILNRNLRAYIVDSSIHKEIPDSKIKLCVEYNKQEIGILYLDCSEYKDFYFKISKHIFYSNKYSFKQIIGLVDSFFSLEYHPTNITRLDIALDTTADTANELYIIADLCVHNSFFKSLSDSEELTKTSGKLNGRKIVDAKYGLTIPKLSIGISKTIKGATDIGKHSGDSFIRCYNKSNKLDDCQKDYFHNIFGDKTIYRLEVSMNSKAIEQANIDLNFLDIPSYLLEVYSKVCKKKLTFNILDNPKKVKGKVKYDQICLLDNLDFGELSDTPCTDYTSDLDNFNVLLKKNVHRNGTKQKRAIISKKIGSYFRQNGKEEILEEIVQYVQENNLDFSSGQINLLNNIEIADKFAITHLSKNHSRRGTQLYVELNTIFNNLEFSGTRKGKPIKVNRVTTENFTMNKSGEMEGIKTKVVDIKVK
jgi:hypothetical protein